MAANRIIAERSSRTPFKSIAQIYKTLLNFYQNARCGRSISIMPKGTMLPYKPGGEAKYDAHKEYRKEQERLKKLFKIKKPSKGIPKPLKDHQMNICQMDSTGNIRPAQPFKSIVHMKKVLLLLYSTWNHRSKIRALPVNTLLPWRHAKKKKKKAAEEKKEREEKKGGEAGEGDEMDEKHVDVDVDEKDEKEEKEGKDEKDDKENKDSEAKYNAHEYYNRIKTTLARQYGFEVYPLPAVPHPAPAPAPAPPPPPAPAPKKKKKSKKQPKPNISRASLRSSDKKKR